MEILCGTQLSKAKLPALVAHGMWLLTTRGAHARRTEEETDSDLDQRTFDKDSSQLGRI